MSGMSFTAKDESDMRAALKVVLEDVEYGMEIREVEKTRRRAIVRVRYPPIL